MSLLVYWTGFKTYLLIDKKQSPTNITNIQAIYKRLSGYFDERSLEFNRENFNQFISYLLEKDHKKTYINNFIKCAKHLDRYLKKGELADYTYFKEPERLVDYLTPEEINKLALVKVKYHRLRQERNLKMKALVFFLGSVGARISETLSLRLGDLTSTPEPMVYFRAETTKNNKARYCIIPNWLYKELLSLPREGKEVFDLDETGIKHDLKERARLCKITKNVYPHVFRHSSINNKLSAGMPLEIVTAYHGHASTSVTYKYYVQIQQKQMADFLYMYDPFFKKGLSFDSLCQKVKSSIDKLVDPKIYNYRIEETQGKLIIEVAQN